MELIQTIDINTWIKQRKHYILIDVRSPKEFAEFRMPHAINIPIFSDEERAWVGTVYTKEGKEAAKDLGIALVSKKLPEIYQQVKTISRNQGEIIFYCWRGGMRSRSITTVMKMMGLPCYQLVGGIRSFRKKIVEDLEEFAKQNKPFYVLEGCTGTRKTDLILALGKRGYPVIDLEGLAGHRGSIFGAVGTEPRSQKQFESDLWDRLNELRDADYFIIEGESKRIGNIVLPPFVIKGKEEGVHFLIEYPFQKRIQAIYETYQPKEQREELYQAFCHLKKYLQPGFIEEIEQAFQKEEYWNLISMLLEQYYDPKYQFAINSYDTHSVQLMMETLEEGLFKIESYLQNREVHSC